MALDLFSLSTFYIIFMTIQQQISLKAMEGNWITKKTIFAPQNNTLLHYQESINYHINTICDLNNKTNFSVVFISKQKKPNKFNINKKIKDQYSNQYNCTYNQNKLIKVQLSKYGMNYIEYIYNISTNFKISIAILKYTNNYIAIIFTSYIKKIT